MQEQQNINPRKDSLFLCLNFFVVVLKQYAKTWHFEQVRKGVKGSLPSYVALYS